MPVSALHNEKELLFLIAGGDEDAFRQLFHHYADLVHNNIYSIVKSEAPAKDLVQDTFLRVWLYRDKLPAIENFRTWLLRIAYNRAFTFLTEKANQEKRKDTHAQKYGIHIQDNQAEEAVNLQALQQLIHTELAAMSPQQRNIYLLSREQGMKLADIATQLGLSEQTVKNNISRALQTLRDAVEKAGFGVLLAVYFWLV